MLRLNGWSDPADVGLSAWASFAKSVLYTAHDLDAAPLRRGSPYCHHHRVRCAGRTQAGARCTLTSSSEHEHAQPLRKGGAFCVHHQLGAREELYELYECSECGELCALKEGEPCEHVCGVSASEEDWDSDNHYNVSTFMSD